MTVSPRLLCVLAFALLPAACATEYYVDSRPSGPARRGFVAQVEASRELASLDDVTAGLEADTSGEPAGNPLTGAFFDDGGDGDVRARTESFFGRGAETVTSVGRPQGQPPAQGQPAPQRMLIHNGQITVEVPKPEAAIAAFVAQVEAWGGYLQAQEDTTVTVRLPAARFDESFAVLRGVGRVLHEHRKADDVTEEFVDLQIRIDNARRARDRLLAILEEAKEVKDILAVEKELRRLTEEIERMEGRRKFLADRVAMATLQAAFQATTAPPPPPKRHRRPSRFSWINLIGAERVMEDF